MGEESDDETAIMIKRPFVRNADGNPVAVPCPECRGKGVVTPPRTMLNLFPAPITCPTCEGSTFATRGHVSTDQPSPISASGMRMTLTGSTLNREKS